MARVVRRRNNPPVLLIVFVFLFVIATAVAVLMFMQRDEANKQIDADSKAKKQNTTDLRKLKSQNVQMVTEIIGIKGKTTQAALDQIDSTYALLKAGGYTERGGLLPTLQAFQNKLDAQKKFEKDQADIIKGLESQIAAKAEEITKRDAKSKAEIDKWIARHAELEKKQEALTKLLHGDKAEMKEFTDSVMEKAQKEKAELLDERDALNEQASRDEMEIRRLKGQIAELKIIIEGKKTGDAKVAADAKIIRVAGDVCFIGLGEEDNIKPGMTFAVFKKGDIGGEKPVAKGKLRVTKVDATFCTCKIVEEDKNSPIVAGDVVANPAYHTTRPTVFVIIGEYDLRGQGPSRAGTEELIAATKHSGGTVEDDVTYRTDYLVVGDRPSPPSKPDELAPAALHKAYERMKKKHDEYTDAKAKADSMRIPVLNLNRFLELTGYVPEKAPE